jgi:HK97 family phage portal protein
MSFLREVVMGNREEQKVVDVTAMLQAGWSASTKSGVSIGLQQAMRISVAFACARVVAEDVGKLPFRLMRETPEGRKIPAIDHPLYWLIYRRPNDWMDSQGFRETLTMHAVFCQGGFAFINRASDGRPLELLPLMPGSVSIEQELPSREIFYQVSDPNGIIGRFSRKNILHVRGPSWDSLGAMELISQAREVLGLHQAIEESVARLHANGARPSGVLSTDQELKEEARKRLRAMFENGFQSVVNTGKVPILDNGLKFIQMGLSSADAQTMEMWRFQIEQVCRMFRVYPQKAMHMGASTTFAASQQFSIDHATDSIDPWAQRWCHALGRDCLTMEEIKSGLYPVMYLQGLMRGDNASRAAYYTAGKGTASSPGWLCPNDIRKLEDMDPLDQPGADKIVTVDDLSGKAQPGAAPGDPSADPAAPADPPMMDPPTPP